MSWFAVGAAVASALVSARGAYVQGQTAKKVGEHNAKMAEYAAQDTMRRGEQAAQAVRQRGEQIKGAQRARMAAAGLDVSQGTAADMGDRVDFFSEVDQNTARLNAKKDAWAQRAGGDQARFQGQAAADQGSLQAFSSVLGGASSVADKWSAKGKS